MPDLLLTHEPTIRVAIFIATLVLMASWEALAPCRRREIRRLVRWPNNLAIVVVDTILLRVTFPMLAVAFAMLAEERGWGLLNLVDFPAWIAFVLALLALDLTIYFQHVMVHAVPVLWRLHRMHHADLDFDVTTGFRFHPLEILLSMGIKLIAIAAIGAPAVAVLVFEILLSASSMFNHANVALPPHIDRWLRWIIVTPDMHRVHHSTRQEETNSNFCFNLPWWDHLFGTYRAQPKDGHAGMAIGIEQFRTPRDLWLDRMLIQPFHGPVRGQLWGGTKPAE